jgi:hypothetical protein
MHSIVSLFRFNTIAKICFEDVERISNAQGIGFHVGCLCINLVAIIGCVFNLGIKDELPLKPKAPITIDTSELEISPSIIRSEPHKM